MTACVLPPMFVADKTSAAAARIFADAVVFPAGTRLTTAELPVLASLGIADAQVVRKCA